VAVVPDFVLHAEQNRTLTDAVPGISIVASESEALGFTARNDIFLMAFAICLHRLSTATHTSRFPDANYRRTNDDVAALKANHTFATTSTFTPLCARRTIRATCRSQSRRSVQTQMSAFPPVVLLSADGHVDIELRRLRVRLHEWI